MSNKDIIKKSYNIIEETKYRYVLALLPAGIAGAIGNPATSRLLHTIIFMLMYIFFALILFLISFCAIYLWFYFPKAINWRGTIGRLEYFLSLFITNLFIEFISSILITPEDLNLNYSPTILSILIGIIITFLGIYIIICATIKRLNDIKWSKWLTIIALIPGICLFVTLPCIFMKGKDINPQSDSIQKD